MGHGFLITQREEHKESYKGVFIYLNPTENRHLPREGSEKFWLIMQLKPACNNQSPHISCGIFCLLGLKSKGWMTLQPYSGHETRQSLEIYSKLSLTDAQEAYDEKIDKFPI